MLALSRSLCQQMKKSIHDFDSGMELLLGARNVIIGMCMIFIYSESLADKHTCQSWLH